MISCNPVRCAKLSNSFSIDFARLLSTVISMFSSSFTKQSVLGHISASSLYASFTASSTDVPVPDIAAESEQMNIRNVSSSFRFCLVTLRAFCSFIKNGTAISAAAARTIFLKNRYPIANITVLSQNTQSIICESEN